jgi:MFS family permease
VSTESLLPSAGAGAESIPNDNDRRNFIINVVEGGLYVAGATFISVQTVLPSMVKQLGGSNVAVGALSLVAWGGLFLPQLFAARYIETAEWKKPWTVQLGVVQRIIVALIGLIILLVGGENPGLALGLFLVLYAVMHVVLGVVTPAWFDLVAKVTPRSKRGRLAGLRSSLAGLMGLMCGLMLTWILGAFEVPVNYALAFFLAFFLQILSTIVQSRLVELRPSQVDPRKPLKEYLRQVPHLFRNNPVFRNFLLAMVFLVLATVSVSFFTVHAINEFNADPAVVGRFTMLMVGAQVLSAPAVGYLADRSGNRMAIIVAAAALFCASLNALLAPTLEWFSLVFVFLGINLGSELMARYNLSIEFAPERNRATYFGLMNAVLAPFYGVGLIGGWLSDLFGYRAVFQLGALCSLTGILIMLYAVRDPRLKEQSPLETI